MTDNGNTRCIECGGEVDQLNEDEEGIPCPACAERLLETLPGLFHQPWSDSSLGPIANEADADGAEGETAHAEDASEDAGSALRARPGGPRRAD